MSGRDSDSLLSEHVLSNPSRHLLVRSAGRWAASVVVAIAALTLVGWFSGSPLLGGVLPGMVPMNPVTGLGLAAAAAATLLLGPLPVTRARLRGATILAALVLLIGTAKLGGYLLGADLAIDRWLLSGPRAINAFQVRIAANTALVLALVGSALLLIAHGGGRGLAAAQALTTGAAVTGFMAILGYAYGAERLYQFGPLVPMALNTAIASMILSASVLALRPDRGFVGAVNAETSFGATARRLIPAIPLLLGVLGWARLRGERVGLYDTPMGTALSVAVATACCFGLVFWNARLMSRAENERRRNEIAVQRLNTQLERNVDNLAEVNQELEAFSYSVSHDLRAPLRHIAGFADLLGKHSRESLDERSVRYLDTIRSSAQRMGLLIDDLLTFAHVGRTELRAAAVNLGSLVSEVLHEFQVDIEARRVKVRVDTLPVVRGDAALLRQVFLNLVSNALKYSSKQAQPALEIGAAPATNGQVVVRVTDNGAGFDPKYTDKLFGVFQRLHTPEEFEGTGIGLANVRRIVTRHGGRVWAEGAVGKGATFYVSLPVESES